MSIKPAEPVLALGRVPNLLAFLLAVSPGAKLTPFCAEAVRERARQRETGDCAAELLGTLDSFAGCRVGRRSSHFWVGVRHAVMEPLWSWRHHMV